MSAPLPYPRIPYVDDEPDQWLGQPVDVEEKLDGANVAVWWEDVGPRVMSRGGPDAMDRSGQLGRLRGWAAERRQPLQRVCGDGTVIYGEWLWLRHRVAYDALPDLLVVLDLWRADNGFVSVETRDSVSCAAGLTVPPRLAFNTVLHRIENAYALIGPASWSSDLAEGLVLRSRRGGGRAKLLRHGFAQRTDDEWRGPPAHNMLA